MTHSIRIALVVLAAFTLAACSEGTSVTPDNEQIVVRAYLFAGQPVTDVQLSRAIPIGSGDSIAPPINDATVTLQRGADAWTLTLAPGDSGMYRYTGGDLDVREGDRFDIRVERAGRIVTASTTVPPQPAGVAISRDTLAVPASPGVSWLRGDSSRIAVTWNGAPGELAYVAVENIEDNPEAISFGQGGFPRGGERRFIAPPTDRPSYTISVMNLTHYGRHRVTVYRINQEYADLYRTRQQDSRDLNEPLTNIVNGLGVFSAFNGVSRTLIITKQ